MPAFFLNRPEGKIGITSGKNQKAVKVNASRPFTASRMIKLKF
jgi:hypothetical protein